MHTCGCFVTQVDNIVKYVKEGLKDRLVEISWMEEKSKKWAIEKVKRIVDKVGYPSWMSDDDFIDRRYSNVRAL